MALHVVLQRQARDPRDDVSEKKEVDVAVDEALARRRRRDFIHRERDGGVVALPRMQIDVGSQSRHVGAEMTHGDRTFAVALERSEEARGGKEWGSTGKLQ